MQLRTCEKPNDTQNTIFSVAAQLFSKRGYNGVSMREISEASGVTKPTIYYYFESKEDIYRQLVETGIDHIFTTIEEVKVLPISAKEKLIEITKRFFEVAFSVPEYVKFFMSLIMHDEKLDSVADIQIQVEKRGRLLIDIIRQGIESGEFGGGADPELAAHLFGGMLKHFIGLQLVNDEKILSDDLAERVVELLFKGLNE